MGLKGLTLLPALACLVGSLAAQTLPLDSPAGLKLHRVTAESATFNGRKAVGIAQAPGSQPQAEDRLAIVTGSDFQDGVIEVDLAGQPGAGAGEGVRGFVGIAFRAAADLSRYECFYLRPTNGRADDQVRRNLKHGESRGAVALWIGPGRLAHFANLRIGK